LIALEALGVLEKVVASFILALVCFVTTGVLT
jgi:hypothetical protein